MTAPHPDPVVPAGPVPALSLRGLAKRFGAKIAVDGLSLDVPAGSFFGIVGPNGAGKTTTLSMATGLLRPDFGTAVVHGVDVWARPLEAKKLMGILPDGVRLFDRLTGEQLVSYAGLLRGMDKEVVAARVGELLSALDLSQDAGTLVVDYSAGMTKKIALACAMIHAPRLLVLDEPFESVDPVSAANLTDILERFVGGGGTVLLSSHGMDLIERVCDSAAIIIGGRVLASGTLDEVRVGQTLEDRFVELAGGRKAAEGMEWLHSFSD
jgi:ABC-2 type transport system ATP-binding protein